MITQPCLILCSTWRSAWIRRLVCVCAVVVDEQNAHTEEQELQSPTDFRKDSEEENRDNEKDEDTKELEALPCEFTLLRHTVAVNCFLWDTECSCWSALKAESSIGLHSSARMFLSHRNCLCMKGFFVSLFFTKTGMHSRHMFCMLEILIRFITVASMTVVQ